MLRRYLIANAVSTVVMYGAIFAFAPSLISGVTESWSQLHGLLAQSPLLAPLFHGLVMLSGG